MNLVHYQLNVIDQQLKERRSFFSDMAKKSPLLLLAGGLIAGAAVQYSFALSMRVWMIVLAITLIGLILWYAIARRHNLIVCAAATVMCFACLGGIRVFTFLSPGPNDISLLVGNERTLATVKGTIISEPIVKAPSTSDEYDENQSKESTSFYLRVSQVKAAHGWIPSSGTIRMQAATKLSDINVGDSVLIYCWLDRPSPPVNPGQFNFKEYLARKAITITGFIKTARGIEVLEKAPALAAATIPYRMKNAALSLLLPQDQADTENEAMLGALLLGNRAELGGEINTAFYKTGLLHILALSGGHVAVLIGIVWWLSKIAGMTKPFRGAICIGFICLFVLIVPPYAPVLRAVIIGLFFCISAMLKRRPDSVNTLALAAIVLIMFRPLEFYEPGWQLSFACVLGILLFTQKVSVLLHDLTGHWCLEPSDSRVINILQKLASSAFIAFAAGLAAMLGGGGILLYHFYNITPLGAIWTMLVMPVVTTILVLGFLKIILAVLLPTIAALLGPIVLWLTWLFTAIVKLVASIDNSQILIGHVPLALIIAYYAFIIFAGFVYFKHERLKKMICVAAVAGLIVPLVFLQYTRTHRDYLELDCLSIGHGQAIVARLPGTGVCLFDCGSLTYNDPAAQVVTPYLNYCGIGNIDAIYISHFDRDHINGIAGVLGQCRVKHLYSITPHREPESIAAASQLARITGMEIETPPQSTQAQDAKITLLWPSPDANCVPYSENDLSNVYLLEFAGRKILLSSDIEEPAQHAMLQQYSQLKIDFAIMPHHGSERTLAPAFADWLAPATKLYSCSTGQFEKLTDTNAPNKMFTASRGAITIRILPDGSASLMSTISAKK